MIENGIILPDYFKYNPTKNTVKINIYEYEYDKSEFDLNTELPECINEINRLYNKCNDDRIMYDSDANTEFYTREAIQVIPQEELFWLNARLEYVTDADEKLKIEYQIEVVEKIDRLLS